MMKLKTSLMQEPQQQQQLPRQQHAREACQHQTTILGRQQQPVRLALPPIQCRDLGEGLAHWRPNEKQRTVTPELIDRISPVTVLGEVPRLSIPHTRLREIKLHPPHLVTVCEESGFAHLGVPFRWVNHTVCQCRWTVFK